MLELAILGFLAEGPTHGYELRRRVAHLSGYARPVSDGSLYPAIQRMVKSGWIARELMPGAGATARHVLTITSPGRERLQERLRDPERLDITNMARFLVILAFLSQLPDVGEQHAVLRQRLDFLEGDGSFFYDGDRPVRADEVVDPYRRGMFVVATATSRTEQEWLRSVLKEG
ncbi:PadR family transcriptional regulator [Kineosporia sp. NBRC 101731]|uniref:PadR family transcriptional regulator n=1 Tax=Kineosporia sp. NBRC 101731 TaxID=3032199 RepID=UPI0025528F8A|nr:PadR family transcriptional regulator [Kineosporia sp. NBRC 101731]